MFVAAWFRAIVVVVVAFVVISESFAVVVFDRDETKDRGVSLAGSSLTHTCQGRFRGLLWRRCCAVPSRDAFMLWTTEDSSAEEDNFWLDGSAKRLSHSWRTRGSTCRSSK